MSTCPVLNFIDCDYSDSCLDLQDRLKDCTVDNILSQPGYQVLQEDTTRRKYKVQPIEQAIKELMEDHFYYQILEWDQKRAPTGSLEEFRNGRKIEPYRFPAVKSDFYHVRGSEFGSDSEVGRLLSKINHPDFPTFPDPDRDAGVLIDKVYTYQHVEGYLHNQTLTGFPLRLPQVRRDEYCQQETFAKLGWVTVMAHPDVTLRMGDTLVVIDVKRAAMRRTGHKKQLLAYALAIDRSVGESFRDYLLININHANIFDKDKNPIFKSMRPRYDIMYVGKDSPLIPSLEREAESSFNFQRRMLEDPKLMRFVWGTEKKQKRAYRGIYPAVEFLFEHIDERFEFLDPRFRRALGPILVK